jgi:diguanylate cyclase (GGDEF)-like protein
VTDLFSAPEPCLREAAWRNEVVVAQIRLVVLALMCLAPIVEIVGAPGTVDSWFGLAFVLAALGFGVVVHVAARRGSARSHLGLFSSLLDVTMVSLGLAFFLIIDRPLTATNSFIIFPVYLLAIAATSLRYDPRICLIAGVVAMAEYAVILKVAIGQDVADPVIMAQQMLVHGEFNLGSQLNRILLVLAASFVAAVSVARARDLLSRSARDPLTGLLNRTAFSEMATVEMARSRRHGGGLALVLLDLDLFKCVNDLHGHQVGDQVLRWFGRELRDSFRESDALARLGGDEFALLLAGPSLGRTAARMEELRRAVEAATTPDTPGARVTFSAGLASYPDDGETIEALLEVADNRLYEAKESGRTRIVLASGPRTAVILVDQNGCNPIV